MATTDVYKTSPKRGPVPLLAQQAPAKSGDPERTGAEIDNVVRGHITSRAYEPYAHGTGHQIGRVAHDGGAGLMPRWERYGTIPFLPIEVGQCLTIEPRLTVPGHGIATCEEIVTVGADGATWVSRPQDPLWLIR